MSDVPSSQRDTRQTDTLRPGRWASFWKISSTILAVVAVVGVILHLTFRDRWTPLAPVFYALPRPIISALLFGAWSTWPSRDRSWTKVKRLAMLAAALVWTAQGTYSPPSPVSIPPDALKVTFWNACRGHRGWQNVRAEIRRWDADVTGLVEAGFKTARRDELWKEAFPDRAVQLGSDGMCLIVRGTIHSYKRVVLSTHGVAGHFDVVISGQPATVLIVDLNSHPGYSRQESLESLARLVRSLPDQPVLVMGDFNTPHDSVWFDALRPQLHSAFDKHGQGYRPTWPLPFPVLTLDQVWHNDRVECSTLTHGWTTVSDHRPVFSRMTLR